MSLRYSILLIWNARQSWSPQSESHMRLSRRISPWEFLCFKTTVSSAGKKHLSSTSMSSPGKRAVMGALARLSLQHSLAPDVERVHPMIQAEMLGVESEFEILPGSLLTPRVEFVRICLGNKVGCCGPLRQKLRSGRRSLAPACRVDVGCFSGVFRNRHHRCQCMLLVH